MMILDDLTNVRRPYHSVASAEQRATIAALGGRPAPDLTPAQARTAIFALRRRRADKAQRAGA